MVDVIRAVNQGYNLAAGTGCAKAEAVREALHGSEWSPVLKKLKFSNEQIAAVAEGAIINTRSGTDMKQAISTAIDAIKNPAAEVKTTASGFAEKFLGERSKSPRNLDTRARNKVKIEEPSHVVQPASKVAKPSGSLLGHMNHQQRIGFGLSAIMAVFGAMGTLDACSKIKKTEADGQSHVQPTQVGLALLNGALTAGMGLAAYTQLRAR